MFTTLRDTKAYLAMLLLVKCAHMEENGGNKLMALFPNSEEKNLQYIP